MEITPQQSYLKKKEENSFTTTFCQKELHSEPEGFLASLEQFLNLL